VNLVLPEPGDPQRSATQRRRNDKLAPEDRQGAGAVFALTRPRRTAGLRESGNPSSCKRRILLQLDGVKAGVPGDEHA
jgi:hypothetical protein